MELSENTKRITLIIIVSSIIVISLVGVFVPESRSFIKDVVTGLLNFIPSVIK